MAFRKRTNAYWDKRAEEQLTFVEQQALPHMKQIDKVYRDARRYTLEEVKKLYLAYYTKQGFDTQALREIAPKGDIRRFKEAVQIAGLTSELPAGYGFRLTRLELVEANLWLEAQKAVQAHNLIQTVAHRETIYTAYNYAAYNLSKGTGVAPAFAQINTRTVDRILKTKLYGKNYSDRIWKNGSRLTKTLKTELASAIASGQSPTKTARNLRERYNVTRYEASRLVRTETNYFNTLGSVENYKKVGLEEFVYVATLDNRTSSICQSLDGHRFPLDDTGSYPPKHPNCVLPGTKVYAPGAESIMRANYSGNIIKIVCANGRELSVTENHIVLTSRGWIRAKFITKLDKIISYGGWGELAKGSPTNNDGIASVEQIFATLGETSGVSTNTVPATTEHLKGDVIPDSNIDIIFIDSLLRSKVDTSISKLLSDSPLEVASKDGHRFLSLGTFNQFLSTTAFAADSIMGGYDVTGVLFGSSGLHHEAIRFGLASSYDTRLSKTAVNDSRGNVEVFGQLEDAYARIVKLNNTISVNGDSLASQPDSVALEQSSDTTIGDSEVSSNTSDSLHTAISVDDVVDVRSEFYSGHVYDLSTMSTLYIANGMMSSNCRSTTRAYLGREYEPNRRIMRDPDTGKNRYISNMSYEQWQRLYL